MIRRSTSFLLPLVVSLAAAQTPWWNPDFKQRAPLDLSSAQPGLVRVDLPAGAKPEESWAVAGGQLLEQWTPTLEMTDVRLMTSNPDENARFPRLLEAGNGDLLLTYRIGHAHAASDSHIAQRISKDKGRTWLAEQNICQFENGVSAQNVIMLATPAGRIVAWVSRFEFKNKGHERAHQFWSQSDDHGATWAPWKRFDPSNERSSYYMTDAIALAGGGLLAIDAAFPPSGAGNCFAQAWRSEDGGGTWEVASRLTEPAENLGDEVGILETRPGEILCLLRDRRGTTTWRMWSKDGGRTWSKRQDIGDMVGCFQRPLLTRLDAQTLLATGRDRVRRQVVAFVSRDNGQTFGERHILESYQADGAYTGAVALGPRLALITWYGDRDRSKGNPEVKLATLQVADRPHTLCFRLPKRLAGEPVYLYFDAPGTKAPGQRGDAFIDQRPAMANGIGTVEKK